MSTMLQTVGKMVRVSTLVSPGKRKRLPRWGFMVDAEDKDAIRAEIMRQGTAARNQLLVTKE